MNNTTQAACLYSAILACSTKNASHHPSKNIWAPLSGLSLPPQNQIAQLQLGDLADYEAALANQVVTSAGVGMRPAQTTFSLMTRPGVDMMLYSMIWL
jgi:hypothetical protein